MTNDRARKKAARTAAGGTRDRRPGDKSYAATVRENRAARMTEQISLVDQVPPVELPGPVAVMMARQVHAALLHLSQWHQLAADHGITRESGRSGEPPAGPTAPVELTSGEVSRALVTLQMWCERNAHASGVVDVVPDLLSSAPEQTSAFQTLYPDPASTPRARRWCSVQGGRMPQPGESHVEFDPATGPSGVRLTLTGPIPTSRLMAHATGRDVLKAADITPGTPADPIWQAHDALDTYACAWMYRGGDSPADLAAAVDGLTELASTLPSVISDLRREITSRIDAGYLTGVDQTRFVEAGAALDQLLAKPDPTGGWQVNALRQGLRNLRQALTGASGALPPNSSVVTRFERRFDGKTALDLRRELGQEVFTQRQINKVTSGDDSRTTRLLQMLAWMHATRATTYRATDHAASGKPGQAVQSETQ